MEPTTQKTRTAERRKAWAELVAADRHAIFGPIFFLQHLRGLVRDHCPDPAEGMPSVGLHLMDGSELDICHIVGIDPHWIALAVREPGEEGRQTAMRTELVPYHMITRVAIYGTRRPINHHVGFDAERELHLLDPMRAKSPMTPEEALRAVAGAGALVPSAPERQSRHPHDTRREK